MLAAVNSIVENNVYDGINLLKDYFIAYIANYRHLYDVIENFESRLELYLIDNYFPSRNQTRIKVALGLLYKNAGSWTASTVLSSRKNLKLLKKWLLESQLVYEYSKEELIHNLELASVRQGVLRKFDDGLITKLAEYKYYGKKKKFIKLYNRHCGKNNQIWMQ